MCVCVCVYVSIYLSKLIYICPTLPAISGADPPEGSYMLNLDPIEADGMRPSEPGRTEAASIYIYNLYIYICLYIYLYIYVCPTFPLWAPPPAPPKVRTY